MRKIFESTGLVKSLGLVGLIATAPIVYAGSVVFGNSTMTLVPSTTKFDTATPLGFDLSGAPCSIFGSDAEAIQNGGCSVDLSFTNVLYSGEIYVGENPDKVNMLTLNVGRSARPNFGAFQVKANIKKYDINGNISDIDDKTVFNGIAQHRSSDITLNQDKTSYIAVKDDVRINFPGDKVIDSASSCMLTQTKIKAQTLLKYGARPSDNICKIEFTHIPVGLKQGYVCSTEQECIDSYFNPDSQNTFEIDKGLVFTGKLLDPKDDKFSYKITRLNGFDIGQDSNGQRIIDITESDPLVYESSIAGVTAFNDGVIFEVSPAIVDGHNFAAVVPVGMTPGIQVVHDRAQAAGVVAQGKTPVLVEIGGYAEVIKSVNVDNFASYLFQLGAPKATGYQFSYKVTALDAAGVNLSTRSGVQVIKDAAPTLTPLTTTAAYIVGGPGTTPQAEFGLLGYRHADTMTRVTLSVDTAPTNGTLDLSKPGKAIYTPKPGFFGGDKFIVRATDGFGAFTVSTQYVNVVNGGVIESSITAPVKVSGYTPFTAGLALKLTDPKNSSNIGSVQWQRQPAGGGDWAPAGTGVTLKATLTESGKFNYRAVVTNKWSQAQSDNQRRATRSHYSTIA
jgi:hypothetical protein